MSLKPLPEEFASTRDALHQIAFFALGPARYGRVGRMGLRAAPGGFGTPEFEGAIARVEGDCLVYERPNGTVAQTITTVRRATEFLGIEYDPNWFEDGFHDPLHPVDPDTSLPISEASSRALGHWYAFGSDVLNELRGHGNADDYTSEVRLWPEHFDAAIEMGAETRGHRASYGASPGDAAHDQPYIYVASWSEIDRSIPYWNDNAFNGASLPYADLLAGEAPKRRALDFLLEGYRILHTT